MRVVGYTRVSRMLEDKLSTQSQTAQIEGMCEREGWELIKIYSDEDLSGAETSQRVQFNQMFEDIETQAEGKIDLVICYNLSRFSRSIIDINMLVNRLKNELDCDFISCQESFIDTRNKGSHGMGAFLLNIFASIAQLERDRLISVVQDSNINRARIGGRYTNGGPPPFGYVKDGKSIKPDAVYDEEGNIIGGTAKTVQDVFSLYIDKKLPASAVARRLNSMEVDPNRPDHDVTKFRQNDLINEMELSTTWSTAKVRRILINPAYTGINVTNRRERAKTENGNTTSHAKQDPSTWVFSQNLKITRQDEDFFWDSDFELLDFDFPPIISWDTFIQAQKQLEEYSHDMSVREKQNYLLKDLLYCGHCGRSMGGKIQYKSKNIVYHYYLCNRKATLGDCPQTNVWCSVVDDYVLSVLSDSHLLLMIDALIYDEQGRMNSVLQEYDDRIREQEKTIRDAEASINNLLLAIKNPNALSSSQDLFVSEINKEQARLEKAKKELETLQKDKRVAMSSTVDASGFMKKIATQNFAELPFDMKREFLVQYVDKVVYYDLYHIDVYLKFGKNSSHYRPINSDSDELMDKIIRKHHYKGKATRRQQLTQNCNKYLDAIKSRIHAIPRKYDQWWQLVNERLHICCACSYMKMRDVEGTVPYESAKKCIKNYFLDTFYCLMSIPHIGCPFFVILG